jgi:DNA-binding LacI/PurR family transcriptional regulator
MAVGALRELRARGRRVPEDVSVTGFDNITLGQFCQPALTTVHIPSDTIGETVFDFLMHPGKVPLPHEFVIDPELVLRESTGAAPSARK